MDREKVPRRKQACPADLSSIRSGRSNAAFSYMTKRFEIDPRLKIIANHFGFQAQAEKAIEEMAELMVEIKHIEKRSENSAYDYVRFIEELADVKIMIDQLVYLVRQGEECADSFDLQTEYKIERTLRRVEAEKEEV